MSHRVIPYGMHKFLWQWHCERRYSVYFTSCILLYHINFRLPTELKLLRSTTSFCCQLKTFQSAYGHRDTAGGDCFVTRPRSATSSCSCRACQIHELESHKKIESLLSLSGLTDNEMSYFIKEPPAKAIVRQKLPRKLQNQDTAAATSVSTAREWSQVALVKVVFKALID